ncbi:MAG: hypothetical protein LBH44_09465 [Treponema sp.]|jgi:hypothetical protein|nr:hypothetical protein [Treponema sp.]
MKKIVLLLTVLAVALLTACDGDDGKKSGGDDKTCAEAKCAPDCGNECGHKGCKCDDDDPEKLPKSLWELKIKDASNPEGDPSKGSLFSSSFYLGMSISFQRFLFNSTMEELLPLLKAQNNTTRTAFNNWSGTSGKSATYRSKIIAGQNGIFENLRDYGLDAGFLAGYGTYELGFGAGKGALDSHYENMENAIYELFSDDAKKADFQNAMKALKLANYVDKRHHGDKGASKLSELNACLDAMGIDPTDADRFIKIEKYLINNMPKEAGGVDFRFNILLQIKNFQEFKGFTQSIIDIGLSPSVSSVDKKTRSQIQTENGLFNSPELLVT